MPDGFPEYKGFEPKLNGDATLSELNEAHQADQLDKGKREEALYPLKNVLRDNVTVYSDRVRAAETPEQLVEAARPLSDTSPGGTTEWKDRTAGVLNMDARDIKDLDLGFRSQIERRDLYIQRWEQNKAEHLATINASPTIDSLRKDISYIRTLLLSGEIGNAQSSELLNAGERRKLHLWEEKKLSTLATLTMPQPLRN